MDRRSSDLTFHEAYGSGDNTPARTARVLVPDARAPAAGRVRQTGCRAVLIAAVVYTVAVTVLATWRGPGMSPDSVAYASAANSLADTGTLTMLDGGYDEHGVRREPLTDDHASQEAVLSPDGQRMVVVSGRGHRHDPDFGFDVTSLFVSELDGGDEGRLTAGHVDELPVWSPDGSQVAFVRRLDRSGDQILVVDVANPSEPALVRTFGLQAARPSYLAWLDDDTVAWWGEAGNGPSPLVSRAADGSGPTSTVVPDVDDPVLSADRTAVAYTAGVEDSDDLQQVAVREIDTGQVSVVADSASMYTNPVAWTRDGRLFFTRNVEGPGVNLVVAEDGGLGSSEVVGQPEWQGYEAVHLNPVCG